MKPTRIATLVTLLVTTGAIATGQSKPANFFTDLKLGSHQVGFRLLIERDRTRPPLPDSDDTTARMMPIAVWYPSAPSATAERLLVGDYARISAQSLSGSATDDGVAMMRQRYVAGGSRTLDQLLTTPMGAVREALPEQGRFPLVLFAHAAPHSQSIMAEHLTSHGFVVAAVQSRGTSELAYKLSRENLDTMVTDLEFVWARMQRETYVQPVRVGLIGMSNGSIGAMALQLRHPSIVAGVVSLDGGIGEDAGGTYLRERSNKETGGLRAPLLHLYTEPNPYLNLAHLRGYNAADRTLMLVKDMRHGDFLNDAFFQNFLTGDERTRHAVQGFTWVARYTLRFLQSALTDRANWLAGDAAPSTLIAIERLPPSP